MSAVIYAIDYFNPTATASFFNIDILATFEDAVIVKGEDEAANDERPVNGDTHELRPVETNANGDTRTPEDGEHKYANVEVLMQ